MVECYLVIIFVGIIGKITKHYEYNDVNVLKNKDYPNIKIFSQHNVDIHVM